MKLEQMAQVRPLVPARLLRIVVFVLRTMGSHCGQRGSG